MRDKPKSKKGKIKVLKDWSLTEFNKILLIANIFSFIAMERPDTKSTKFNFESQVIPKSLNFNNFNLNCIVNNICR